MFKNMQNRYFFFFFTEDAWMAVEKTVPRCSDRTQILSDCDYRF